MMEKTAARMMDIKVKRLDSMAGVGAVCEAS